MSSKLLFAGRTAIVTGAGGGLGKAYALELAKRGANVLVNDFGGSLDGSQGAEGPAQRVASLINESAYGGRAVANSMSVLEGPKIVEQAIQEFGKVDILINNAGILRDKSLAKMTVADFDSVIDVHLRGSFLLCHSIWSHFIANKFGRIVNIGSGAGLYGNFGQTNYSAAKMGILGMTNTLAVEGVKHNIIANCVVPIAVSRMTESLMPEAVLSLLQPEHVAPIVTYLCHESNQESGACFEVGGGWYSKIRIQRSFGLKLGDKERVATAEDIAAAMPEINDFTRSTYPRAASDALTSIMSINKSQTKETIESVESEKQSVSKTNATSTTSEASSGRKYSNSASIWQSDSIFQKFQNLLKNDPKEAQSLAAKIRAKVQIDVSKTSEKKIWLLNLVSNNVTNEQPWIQDYDADYLPSDWKAHVTLQCSDETLSNLLNGKVNPEMAYLRGNLKIKGSMGVALKIKPLIEAVGKL